VVGYVAFYRQSPSGRWRQIEKAPLVVDETPAIQYQRSEKFLTILNRPFSENLFEVGLIGSATIEWPRSISNDIAHVKLENLDTVHDYLARFAKHFQAIFDIIMTKERIHKSTSCKFVVVFNSEDIDSKAHKFEWVYEPETKVVMVRTSFP
jgi:hypothetical protein